MNRRSGITLVEVAVVLCIIFLLIGLLLPALQSTRRHSGRTRGQNNLKQIALACHNYNDAYSEKLPPLTDQGKGAPTGYGLQSLFFNILPYIEQDNVYRRFQRTTASYVEAAGEWIRVYVDPQDESATEDTRALVDITVVSPDKPPAEPPAGFSLRITGRYATASFAANGLVFGSNTARLPGTFKDGTSNTIMFAQRRQFCQPADGSPVYNLWAYGAYGPSTPAFALLTPDEPAGLASTGMVAPVTPLPKDYTKAAVPVRIGTVGAPVVDPPKSAPFQTAGLKPCDPRVPQSPYPSGMATAMADGSVRTTAATISQWTFWAACTPDGNESLGPDW